MARASYKAVKIEGMPLLMAKLQALPKAVESRISRKVMRAGTAPLVKAMRRNAPVGPTKNLKKSMATKIKRYKRSKVTLGMVGPKKHAAPHDHLVEYGTAPRYHKKTGKYVGQMPANPFARRSADETHAASEAAMEAKAKAEIEKEAMLTSIPPDDGITETYIP